MKPHVRDLARRAFLYEVDGGEDRMFGLFGNHESQLIELKGQEHMSHIGEVVCTIGAFDGVHQGHRFLFSSTIADAKRRGLPSVIVTFDPDPDELFLPQNKVRKLLNNKDRLNFLCKFGADFVVSIPFTRELAAHSAEGFLQMVVNRAFKPRAIHVGSDFKLGANNAGNVSELRIIGKKRSTLCDVYGYDLLCTGSQIVSATRIRVLIQNDGDCATATELLCRPHFVRGMVVEGRHQGSGFGFPTANVELSYPYVVPAEGVYACLVLVGDMVYPAAVNVGIPRTFANELHCASIEGNLLGYHGDLYGQEVSVAFIEHLRGQKAFDSLDELIAAVNGNIDWVAQNIGSEGFSL